MVYFKDIDKFYDSQKETWLLGLDHENLAWDIKELCRSVLQAVKARCLRTNFDTQHFLDYISNSSDSLCRYTPLNQKNPQRGLQTLDDIILRNRDLEDKARNIAYSDVLDTKVDVRELLLAALLVGINQDTNTKTYIRERNPERAYIRKYVFPYLKESANTQGHFTVQEYPKDDENNIVYGLAVGSSINYEKVIVLLSARVKHCAQMYAYEHTSPNGTTTMRDADVTKDRLINAFDREMIVQRDRSITDLKKTLAYVKGEYGETEEGYPLPLWDMFNEVFIKHFKLYIPKEDYETHKRFHFHILWHYIWNTKKALMQQDGLEQKYTSDRIVPAILSEKGGIGKSLLANKFHSPLFAAHLASPATMADLISDKFSKNKFEENYALVFDEVDFSSDDGDTTNISLFKQRVTDAVISGRLPHTNQQIEYKNNASLFFTLNHPLRQVFEGSGDPATARRLWQMELKATRADFTYQKNSPIPVDIDFDKIDWKAVWKCVNSNTDFAPLYRLSEQERNKLHKVQEDVLNSGWFEEAVIAEGLETNGPWEESVMLKAPAFETKLLEKLKADHMVSENMKASYIRRKLRAFCSKEEIIEGKASSGNTRVYIVNNNDKIKKLPKREKLEGLCKIEGYENPVVIGSPKCANISESSGGIGK